MSLEGEGAHSPPSDTIILQLSTLKKIREKKTISTRHDVEPLGVGIATGGGPLPSSNKSVRPCAALPTFITNKHHFLRFVRLALNTITSND